MKKLILLLLFVTAFSVVSKAYNNSYYLSCSYTEKFKDKLIQGISVNFVHFVLTCMCNPKYSAYTHGGITMYGANMVKIKSFKLQVLSPKGTYSMDKTFRTQDTQPIKTLKLQASGEGRGGIDWKETYSGSVLAEW